MLKRLRKRKRLDIEDCWGCSDNVKCTKRRCAAKGTAYPQAVKWKAVELLQSGNSFKDVAKSIFEMIERKPSRDTLYEWGKAVSKSRGCLAKRCLADRRANKKTKGRYGRGTFASLLVPHLNKIFRGMRVRGWRYWTLQEIRFWLLFAVLPPRIAFLNGQFSYNVTETRKKEVCGEQWCREQIRAHLTKKKQDSETKALLAAIRAFRYSPAFSLTCRPSFKACERSILLALKEAEYVKSVGRLHLQNSPYWVKVHPSRA